MDKRTSVTKIGFLIFVIGWAITMILFVDIPYNTVSTGLLSKAYLFKALLDASLACLAGMKIYENISGLDHHLHVTTDEGDLDIPSFHIPNLAFYPVILAYAVIMLMQAVDANTESTGAGSIWFLLWCATDFFLAVGCVFQTWVAWQIKQRRTSRTPARQ